MTVLKNMDVSVDELYELFYVAAYGCHRQCERAIKRVFYDHCKDNTLFLFFEWFLSQPLPVSVNGWEEGWEKETYILAPFAPRLAEHSVIVPVTKDANPNPSLSFRTVDAFRNMRLRFRWDKSLNTSMAWDHWRGEKEDNTGGIKGAEDLQDGKINGWPKVRDGATGKTYSLGWIDQWTYHWQVTYAKKCSEGTTKASLKALALLYKPLFIDNGDKRVTGIFIPIASSRLFYGGVWVKFPGLSKSEDGRLSREERSFVEEVGLRVIQTVNRSYLPVLAVLHEHWLEHLHDVWLKDKKQNPTGLPPSVDSIFAAPLSPVINETEAHITVNRSPNTVASFRNPYANLEELKVTKKRAVGVEGADDIEDLFSKLWSRRDDLNKRWAEEDIPDRDHDEDYVKALKTYIAAFKDSLIFKNYLICSESMTQLLGKVIVSAKTLMKVEGSDTLPACLVVGGAGSGKEKLAKMLRLFSDGDYHQGKDYVINMAAIRPAPLTAAAVAGFELQTHLTTEIKVKGFLQRILEEAKESGKSPTLRFDEFNSMDPDSQGVLLRFLDNSEVIPIGGLKDNGKDHVDCLVIGIMNEDPDEISRERAIESFKNFQYLGSFLGDLLYEQFLKMRRLRPDIMYRMKRNGKFVIPALRERREDIPLLFYVFVRDEIRARNQHSAEKKKNDKDSKELHLSLEVLSRLMQVDLSWPGNIRQLQALAKLVAERLMRETDHHVVTLRIVDAALRDVGLVGSV